MKILLIQDVGVNIDLEKSARILNSICKNIKFESYNVPINIDSLSSHINLEKEISVLNQKISDIEKDYVLYLTYRRYSDNFFAHSSKNITIWSFWGWKHYTNLPLENGLFYAIADILALQCDKSFRHDNLTGCIYDFLWDKTDIDIGMKMGYICEECLARVKNKLKKSNRPLDILSDLIEILNLLSNASRWGKSVFEIEKDTSLVTFNWSTFEDEVAQIYRKCGAHVEENVKLAGFQIDIYLEEKTPSGQIVRSVVECKFQKSKVGNRVVNEFSRVVKTLKDAGLVDKGIIVSYSGFSDDAYLVSKTTGIELLLFKDLQQRFKVPSKESGKTAESIIEEKEAQERKRKVKSPDIFVIMPFSQDLDDVYHLGIRETAEELGLSCKRVDEIEFVGGILDEIYNSITYAKIVVAEITFPNPNVYYEWDMLMR